MFKTLQNTALTAAFILVGVTAQAEPLQAQASAIFGPLPKTMPGSENDTPALISLGEKLFMDKRLSINDTQSCNSCHDVTNAGSGVDNVEVSAGAIDGRFGNRNAPTVWNAGFQFAQFWDGREPDLKSQAKGPILNHVEMGMHSADQVIEKLSGITEYQKGFKAAFNSDDAINYDNLAHAIAAFERTLITKDRFDVYMKGDVNALNQQEKDGLQAFINTGCIACHRGTTLGGNMFQKLGVVNPYKNQSDQGRFELTQNPEDKMTVKVPMLRDIARTAPYFHDGKVETLEEAVSLMGSLQLGRNLDKKTVDDMVAFLKAMSHDDSL